MVCSLHTWFLAMSSATHRVSQKWWDMQQSPRQIEKDRGYFSVCTFMTVCVCHREIAHNKYFQMTCWCPQRECHYLIAKVRFGAPDWSQSSQWGGRFRGPILRANYQSHFASSTGEEKLSPKYTHSHYINTHTCIHIHRGYRPIH